MINATVTNDDGIHDLFVTVVDLNLAVNAVALDRRRINKGDGVPISLQEDSDGHGSISWTVNPADEPATVRSDNVTVNDGDVVKVSS
jgi:translation initiation factor IF-1